jgi:hypothetical protein
MTKYNWLQHAIKNIGQKVLDLNDITLNKRHGNLTVRSFEMPYVSYCQPLCTSGKKTLRRIETMKLKLAKH